MKDMTTNYYNTYIENCYPLLSELEEQRKYLLKEIKNKIKTHLLFFSIILLFAIIFPVLCYLSDSVKNVFPDNFYNVFFTISVILPCIIIAYLGIGLPLLLTSINNTDKNFKKELKNKLLPILIKSVGTMDYCGEHGGLPLHEILNCGLFDDYQTNRLSTDDTFSGVYQDLFFRIVECDLIRKTSKSKDTLFKGVLLVIDSNKTVKNTTLLTTKYDMNTGIYAPIIFGISAITMLIASTFFIIYSAMSKNWRNLFNSIILFAATIGSIKWGINKYSASEKFEKIKLEDPEINNKFNAYSSDQIEGRYLLTTGFIERFNNLKTAFGTSKLKCSFYKNKIYIAIHTPKDLFEFGSVFHDVRNQTEVNNFYNEITAVYKIIDYLKLDNKTGL